MKRMQRWKQFEHHCIALHKQEHGGHAWHWSHLPESVLIDSGFFSKTFELRHLREQHHGHIPEFGLDGIALHADGVYHGIQAKLWRTVLCAGNLGTFLSVVYGRMRRKNSASTGFLYHTGTLDHHLRSDLVLMTNIVAKHLKFPRHATPEITAHENIQKFEDRAALALITASQSPWLCPAQMQLACGLPSAPITIRFLEHAFSNTTETVVVASHMHQTRRRILKQVLQVLPRKGVSGRLCPDVISTTHGSMHNFFHLDAFFVINEANMISNEQLASIPARSLLICNKLLHNIPALFTYSMSDAISNGHLCDYTINLPVKEKVVVPPEMSGHREYVAALCLFLISGMLETGSFRCVVYTSIDDANGIAAAFLQCCALYHHIQGACFIFDDNTNQRSKCNIITSFENDSHQLAILISTGTVQTTTGADSICISEESMAFDNILQYISSANQTCSMRPGKVVNAFVFCGDTSPRRKMLASLHGGTDTLSRIRLISANYDTKTDATSISMRNEQLQHVIHTIRQQTVE